MAKDTSKEGYARAIANVKALGANNASKSDVEMATKYASLQGELGNKAR